MAAAVALRASRWRSACCVWVTPLRQRRGAHAGRRDGVVPVGRPGPRLLSFVLIRWRHRHPAAIALVLTAFGCVSAASAGPASWVVGSLASHRRWRLLARGDAAQRAVRGRAGADRDLRGHAAALGRAGRSALLVNGILIATGYAMGSQRQLVDSYRDRAETAEREQRARVAQAQAAERTRIAREMHDVLAHRISLVAMNAGALGYRTDLTAEEQATRREVHRGERPPGAVGPAGRARRAPRPDPARRGGPRAPAAGHRRRRRPGGGGGGRRDARTPLRPGRRASCPPAPGGRRTASCRRRSPTRASTPPAPPSPSTSPARPTTGSSSRCATRRRSGRAPRPPLLPASGLGLLGLAERAALAGGRINHGVDASGGYAVRAWIPWES